MRFHLLEHLMAMNLDRPFRNTEIEPDLFVELTANKVREDLGSRGVSLL
jgi:hypothetical protein